MKPSKITVVVLILSALFATQATAQEISTRSNVLAEVSFEKDEAAIFVPVTLAGKKYYFLLDTGATYNVYDLSLKKHLGTPLGGSDVGTVSGTASVSFFNSPEAKLGSLSLKTKEAVVCYDFTMLSYIIGRRVHGIIGMSFLKNNPFKVDFDNHKLTFYKSLKDVKQNGWSPFPVKFGRKKRPWINGLIPGGKLWFLVDTGDNSNGSLPKQVFDFLVKKEKLEKLDDTLMRSLNQVITNSEGLLSAFYLEPFIHRKILLSSGFESSIGLNLLKKYSILFDFPQSKIHLKKRKFFRKDVVCKVGVSLIRKDGKNLVYKIKKSSPAERSGLKKDDVLLSVDGKNSNKFTLFLLRRYLEKPGQVLQLKISRKGKIMKLQLKPEFY